MEKIELVLPIKTVSEANRRDCWQARYRRAADQRKEAKYYVRDAINKRGIPLTPGDVTVIITRRGPRRMDGDNLCGALKAVRDGIADGLGYTDDSHPDLMWAYAQEPGKHAVHVDIEIHRRAEVVK